METAYKLRNSKLGPRVVDALKKRFFDAWYFDDPEEAADTVVSLIPKEHVVSWGGSMTVVGLGIQERLEKEGYNLIDRDKAPLGSEERMELMRKALLCDTFLCGSNAISEDGQLVNIDNYGNRTAAMIFGPKQVIVAAGINKVVKTVEDAMVRARTIAAPLNIQRFPGIATPCSKTGSCANCLTHDTVCSYFVTTRLCKPAGRIKVILIGKNLGL
jgi:L-lactate utilization protein LutB